MKKLKKLNLNNSEILNASQMKNIVGGYGNGSECPNAGDACSGKSDGASCQSGPECKSGYCKAVPFGGLTCFRQ